LLKPHLPEVLHRNVTIIQSKVSILLEEQT